MTKQPTIVTLALLFVLLPALPLTAQTPPPPAPPNHVEIMVLPPTGDPLTVTPVASLLTDIGLALACNMAPSPGPGVPLTNPTTAEFSDPFTAGRVCRVPFPPLSAIPNGSDYRTVAVFISDTCEINGKPAFNCRSPRSALGLPPFGVFRWGPPAAPTGLGIRQ